MKKKLLFFILTNIVLSVTYAQEIHDLWSGKLHFAGQEMTIILHFHKMQNGDFNCKMDCIEQGIKDIPMTLEKLDQDSLVLNIPAISARYEGVRLQDKIVGTFLQSGYHLSLNLAPGNIGVVRIQNPSEPFPYQTENVSFKNETDSVCLSGTLTYPLTYQSQNASQTPVVILISGSGPQNRDSEIMGHKPFLVIADYLARHGIASLRYDDRGTGLSSGTSRSVTVESNLRDALAGFHYLEKSKKFGPIGIIGHSEGGTLAFMAAAKVHPAFIISLAGVAVPGKELIIRQNKEILIRSGASQTEVEHYLKALDIVLTHHQTNQRIVDPPSFVDNLLSEKHIKLSAPLKSNLETVCTSNTPWLHSFLNLTPSIFIEKTKCPVMALNGELDLQVDATDNLSVIKAHLPMSDKHKIEQIPGLNHLFQPAKSGLPIEYGTIPETFSPDVLEKMAEWIFYSF